MIRYVPILYVNFFVCSMCKVLENRAQQDEERMDQLTNQLKEARLLAEDADGKSDEVKMLNYFPFIFCFESNWFTSNNFLVKSLYQTLRNQWRF